MILLSKTQLRLILICVVLNFSISIGWSVVLHDSSSNLNSMASLATDIGLERQYVLAMEALREGDALPAKILGFNSAGKFPVDAAITIDELASNFQQASRFNGRRLAQIDQEQVKAHYMEIALICFSAILTMACLAVLFATAYVGMKREKAPDAHNELPQPSSCVSASDAPA